MTVPDAIETGVPDYTFHTRTVHAVFPGGGHRQGGNVLQWRLSSLVLAAIYPIPDCRTAGVSATETRLHPHGRAPDTRNLRLVTAPRSLLFATYPNGGRLVVQLVLTLVCSVFGLAFAVYLARWVLQKEDGTQEMRAISDAIREGAEAFLRRQYGTITLLTVPVTVILFVLYAYIRPENAADPVDRIQMAIYVAGSFIFGALCSGIAGYIGMFVSIRTNIRTASAARTSINDGLRIALRGGAVSGLFVVAMSLVGVGGLFLLCGCWASRTRRSPS